MEFASSGSLCIDFETGEGQQVVSQGAMTALGLHGPEKDVAVAASDDRKIGSGFEFVSCAHPLRDDDLAFDREGRCHEVGFSYSKGLSRTEAAC